MQHENASLSAGLLKARNVLVCRVEHSNDQVFAGLVRKMAEERGQAKSIIYEG